VPTASSGGFVRVTFGLRTAHSPDDWELPPAQGIEGLGTSVPEALLLSLIGSGHALVGGLAVSARLPGLQACHAESAGVCAGSGTQAACS
jgi:hypothetical protein